MSKNNSLPRQRLAGKPILGTWSNQNAPIYIGSEVKIQINQSRSTCLIWLLHRV
jgi:hypothetical protein